MVSGFRVEGPKYMTCNAAEVLASFPVYSFGEIDLQP